MDYDDKTLTDEIFNVLEQSFEGINEQIDSQETDQRIKKTKYLAIINNELPRQQAKFFAMMELILEMLGHLREIAENKTKKGNF